MKTNHRPLEKRDVCPEGLFRDTIAKKDVIAAREWLLEALTDDKIWIPAQEPAEIYERIYVIVKKAFDVGDNLSFEKRNLDERKGEK